VVVWDNLNTHVSAAMAELIAARDWSHLKRSLANLAKHNITQLSALVKTRLKRMQYRPSLLDGFLASTGLDLTPFCNSHH
jgi:putative transposase